MSEQCGPVTVKVEPAEQTVAQGNRAELVCTAAGAVQLTWEKVGEELRPAAATAGRLNIPHSAVSDRGLYVCTAVSECGARARASGVLEVEPREPPVVEIHPAARQTAEVGESVLWQCRYTAGLPAPVLSWRRDGGALPSGAEILPGIIYLSIHPSKVDFGITNHVYFQIS